MWAMATTSRVLPEVFESLCWAAAAKVHGFNAQEVANTLWAMAKSSRVLPEVFESLCRAAAAKVQDFNMREVANSLWAMTTASRVQSEVCDSLCYAAAAKVLGVSGSGSEGEGLPHARGRQHAGGHSQD